MRRWSAEFADCKKQKKLGFGRSKNQKNLQSRLAGRIKTDSRQEGISEHDSEGEVASLLAGLYKYKD